MQTEPVYTCKFCGGQAMWWFISGLIKTCNNRECKNKVFNG